MKLACFLLYLHLSHLHLSFIMISILSILLCMLCVLIVSFHISQESVPRTHTFLHWISVSRTVLCFTTSSPQPIFLVPSAHTQNRINKMVPSSNGYPFMRGNISVARFFPISSSNSWKSRTD